MRVVLVAGALVVGAAVALLLAGVGGFGSDDEQRPEVSVDFLDSDGLPEQLLENTDYRATFTIEWDGPTAISDGQAHVYASRLGDTSDDAPPGGWPLVCEAEYDNVVFRTRLSCPFRTPGPGEFALLLEVVDPDGGKLGEGLYTHLIVAPGGDSAPSEPTAASVP